MSILDDLQLSNKIALVTGCRRGIGKAMAVGLAEAGADIIGVRRNLELNGSQVEEEVKAFNKDFHSYTCDFSNREALYTFINQVNADFPVIDILVNNAGAILRKPAAEHPDEYWDKIIDINQSAQFILTREIGKYMVERRNGKIIFTASLLTFQGGITVPGYAATKGAVGQLTMAFANEWASKGVNVNAIAPGYITTDNIKFTLNTFKYITLVCLNIHTVLLCVYLCVFDMFIIYIRSSYGLRTMFSKVYSKRAYTTPKV